jgi:ADP-ribosylglycohydrolase
MIKENKHKLYGAILGDLAGQPYEFLKMNGDYSNPPIHNPASVFTDDTIMTLATAKALLDGTSFEFEYKAMGKLYPGDHYGKSFKAWLQTEYGVKNDSFGNGCLMRLSPIMYINDIWGDRIVNIFDSCNNSHNNPVSYSSCYKLMKLYDKKEIKKKIPSILIPNPSVFKKFEVRADKTYDFVNRLYWSNNSTHSHNSASIQVNNTFSAAQPPSIVPDSDHSSK